MNGPLLPIRSDRTAAAPRPLLAAPRGAAGDDLTPDQQDQLAAQHAAFDFDVAERAELLRERAALAALVLEDLKNEDEIMKKFIALI
jgi:hypothetical protein